MDERLVREQLGEALGRVRPLVTLSREGLVLTAVTNDPNHDLHPSKVVERPKVIYNRTTQQFVMWLHVDSANYEQIGRAHV